MNLYDYNQKQPLLFPAYIKDKLPDDHLAVIISDIVERLDLNLLYRKVPIEGHPSYHPAMMLKVLIYAYATGTFSSRKIEQALNENIPSQLSMYYVLPLFYRQLLFELLDRLLI